MMIQIRRIGKQIAERRVMIFRLVVGIAVIVVLILIGYRYQWTGFKDYTSPAGEFHRGKTLWDWLNLLIVPAVLAGGALLFISANQRDKQAHAVHEDQLERKIASDRIQEQVLQTYLDRMTELLLEKGLRSSQPGDEVRTVARARTLTVLRDLDGIRKRMVALFLYEAGLTGRKVDSGDRVDSVVDLSDADLSEADLFSANLSGANLSGANLRFADLRLSDLRAAALPGADLSGANLTGANLSGVNLSKASLIGTNLSKADLHDAELRGANLRFADLSAAVANLEQLSRAASLEGTTLPDGSKHD